MTTPHPELRTSREFRRLAPEARAVASDEVAEFLLYLIRQSDKSAIDDLLENANKYSEL
jgi:hypothetical protein